RIGASSSELLIGGVFQPPTCSVMEPIYPLATVVSGTGMSISPCICSEIPYRHRKGPPKQARDCSALWLSHRSAYPVGYAWQGRCPPPSNHRLSRGRPWSCGASV